VRRGRDLSRCGRAAELKRTTPQRPARWVSAESVRCQAHAQDSPAGSRHAAQPRVTPLHSLLLNPRGHRHPARSHRPPSSHTRRPLRERLPHPRARQTTLVVLLAMVRRAGLHVAASQRCLEQPRRRALHRPPRPPLRRHHPAPHLQNLRHTSSWVPPQSLDLRWSAARPLRQLWPRCRVRQLRRRRE
jgi:hypothetical protein